MEPPAPYSNTDTAEIEAINTLRSLLDVRRVKADLRERDKFPNFDGYLELVDDQGRPCGKIEVQVKRIGSAGTSCPCPGGLVGYAAVTTLPVILVGVDPTTPRAYWAHVSQLMPDYKANQHTFTVHFTDAVDYIDTTSTCPCYHRWLRLAQEYQERVRLSPTDRIQPPSVASLTPTQVDALQRFIDSVNELLDRDFIVVKTLLFPGIWKFGVGCRLMSQDLVLYQLLRIPRGRPAPLVVELSESVTLQKRGLDIETTTVMSRESFFGDPSHHGREFVFRMLRHLVRAKALPLYGAGMAADVVFGFVRRYHRWLEINPHRDQYQLDELRLAFGPHLSRTTGSVAARLPKGSTGIRVVDLDLINQISSIPAPGHDQRETPAVFVLSSGSFPLKASFQSIALLSSLEISTIERRFRMPDLEYQPPPNNFIWSCFSRDREIESANAILECVVSEYQAFILGCKLPLESSPYLDNGIAVAFRYVSAYDRPAGHGPAIHEYHLRNPHGALPKTTVFSETMSRGFEGAQVVSTLLIDNKLHQVTQTISRSADFLFGDTPLLNLIYAFLEGDLKSKYARDVP